MLTRIERVVAVRLAFLVPFGLGLAWLLLVGLVDLLVAYARLHAHRGQKVRDKVDGLERSPVTVAWMS